MTNTPPDYLKRILNSRVYDIAQPTALEHMHSLSRRINNNILLKREDTQAVFSFKIRGAYNKMAHLSSAALQQGVICASAGNHAQGVALSAQKLGIRAVIVMPVSTPKIKVDAVRTRGAEVVLTGESFSDAYLHARHLEQQQQLTFVHPFDDPDVIAGQGTIGMEILQNARVPIHAVFCCVGGGGLMAGVAAAIKSLRPEIRVIGVEAQGAEAMTQSLQAGHPVHLEQVGLFADGAAVKQVGDETFRLCQHYVDEMIVVDNDAICAAIKDVFEDTRSILEPAGALSVAGIKEYIRRHQLQDKNLVAIASGANMNFDRLRFVAERAEIGEEREAVLAVTIPEKAGAFRAFCALLGQRSITEFSYRYADHQHAHILLSVSIESRREVQDICQTLSNEGLETLDLSDDDLAKTHIRYMVGGHAPHIENERLYRFIFPERPGALMHFLSNLHSDWNISLFHYRNHGSDFGRVLVGMQVPADDQARFARFVERLGYECSDESTNPAYQRFLGR